MYDKILFTGDFFFDYNTIPADISRIGNWIRENKFKTIMNLEGSISDPDPQYAIEKRGPNLASSQAAALVLKELNTVGVSLANNHMMDYGEYGLKSTLSVLDKNDIKHTGAGLTLDEALIPFTIDTGNIKIGVLAFGWDVEETRYASEKSAGCAPRKKDIIVKAVSDAKEYCDRVVVCMHWGFEFNRYPMPYDTDLAHSLIDAGADLIIGSHPHCVQPYEVYKGKTIYYSLGNFYFGSKRGMFTKKFNEKIANQPDYGIIVIYDPVSEKTDTRLIVYSRKENESAISDTGKEDILYPLPALSEKEYYKSAYKARNNSTPMLTANDKINEFLIRKLYTVYSIKKAVRKLIPKRLS